MIVRTSGSCSRSFSARRPSESRRKTVGKAPATAPAASPSHGDLRIRNPMIIPAKAAPMVTTTNSPDRRLIAAASSSASRRSLKPRESANRRPKLLKLWGIHPPALRSSGICATFLPRFPTAAIRSPMMRCLRRRAAVPNNMTPRKNAAAVTSPIESARAAGVPQKDATAVIRPSLGHPERRGRGRRTRRAPPACRGTWAAGPWTSADRGTCLPRRLRQRSRTGRCPAA
jgi:hypothetical protein